MTSVDQIPVKIEYEKAKHIQKNHIQHQKVVINQSNGCTIEGIGIASSLKVQDSSNSYIFIAPCQQNVKISNCRECCFTIACSKITISNCSDCTFYLYTSEPVHVRDSFDLRFGLFNGAYAELSKYFDKCGFKKHQNQWRTIVFNHQTTPAPRECYHILEPKVNSQTGALSEFVKEKLRQVFRLYDLDADGQWSIHEFNAFLKDIDSPIRVTHEHHMQKLLQAIGLDIGKQTFLSRNDLITLYTLQGLDEVKQDLRTLNISLESVSQWKIAASTSKQLEFDLVEPINPVTLESIDISKMNDIERAIYERLQQVQQPFIHSQQATTLTSEPLSLDQLVPFVEPVKKPLQDKTPKETPVPVPSGERSYTNETQDAFLQTVKDTLQAAQGHGVDLSLWFAYFDSQNTGYLTQESFECALTGIGLGLNFEQAKQVSKSTSVDDIFDSKLLQCVLTRFVDKNSSQIEYKKFLKQMGVVAEKQLQPKPKEQHQKPEKKELEGKRSLKKHRVKTPRNRQAKAISRTPKEPQQEDKEALKEARKASVKAPFGIVDIENKLRHLFKASPEKYGIIWRACGFQNEATPESTVVEDISPKKLGEILATIGIPLEASIVDLVARRIISLSSDLSQQGQEREKDRKSSNQEDTTSGAAYDVLMQPEKSKQVQSSDEIKESLVLPRHLVQTYFRSLKLNHLISHDEWRHRKQKTRKDTQNEREQVFLQALDGEAHDLSQEEISEFVANADSSVFPPESLEFEARLKAKEWAELLEGRAVVHKKTCQLTSQTNPSSKKFKQVRAKVRRSEIQARKYKILSTPEELNALKQQVFQAYQRSCHQSGVGCCPSFALWLAKRQSAAKEQDRLIKEWAQLKKKQMRQDNRSQKYLASLRQLRKQLDQVVSKLPHTSHQGLDINRSLLHLARESNFVPEVSTSEDAAANSAAWWNRLSSPRLHPPIDGVGGVISREACLDAAEDIAPFLSEKLFTNSSEDLLEEVRQEFKQKQIQQTEQENLWHTSKLNHLKAEKREYKQQQKLMKQNETLKKQKAQQAYAQWTKGVQRKKYYSYQQRQFCERPKARKPFSKSIASKPWVDVTSGDASAQSEELTCDGCLELLKTTYV